MSGWYIAAIAVAFIGLALDIYIGCTARRVTDDYSGLVGIVVVTALFGGVAAILAVVGLLTRLL